VLHRLVEIGDGDPYVVDLREPQDGRFLRLPSVSGGCSRSMSSCA
jgi:hypothetical protein